MHPSSFVTSILVCWWIGGSEAFSGPRSRGSAEVVASKSNAPVAEPTCEELKAMWRFSKRQSRAAEITNEIPMYRDPFSDNVWEPYYPTSRSMGGMRLAKYRLQPIYGRVVHKAPLFGIQDLAERNRAFEEVAKMYGTAHRQTEPRRRVTAFRLSGGGHLPGLGLPPQSGSFQHLKELIRTERARELQQQRMAEEIAARAAAFKEFGHSGILQNQPKYVDDYRDINYNYDTDAMEGHRDNYMNVIRHDHYNSPRSYEDYGYFKNRPKNPSLLDASSINIDDYEGVML